MNHNLLLLLMVAAGFVLGMVYFAGLMKTMHWIMSRKNWRGMMLLSFLFRAGLLVVAFFFLAGTDWQRITALVVGFMISRLITVYRFKKTRPLKEKAGTV
jgi:F1F0 ATPase subunit 2